jgi:hypothetical protein
MRVIWQRLSDYCRNALPPTSVVNTADEASQFLLNVGKHLQYFTASHAKNIQVLSVFLTSLRNTEIITKLINWGRSRTEIVKIAKQL